MKGILKILFGAPKSKTPQNGTCARCSNSITPYERCCIIGYDSKKGYHPKSECNHIICYRCVHFLQFETNAVHVSNNNSWPTVFFPEQDIKRFHEIEKQIHESSKRTKKIGKWKTRKRRK